MKIKDYFKNHYLAIFFAVLVGFIYLAPNLFFVLSLGGDYQGIPIMRTANEDYYLARIQEILDGHFLVASHGFYEYKDQLPTAPPVGEFFYALPALLFGVSPANVLMASRFILPFILFLLVYFLMRKLTGDAEIFSNKINAVAGALFVTLGYDLADFRGIFKFLSGGDFIGSNFLMWARPVNPILGAIFLFSFLILIWKIIEQSGRRAINIFGASIFLALMIGSYFFSWGIALSVTAMLILIYFLRKEYKAAKNLIFVLLSAFVFSAPYWYLMWRSSQSPWYEESLLRSGMFYTHYPLLNKIMLAVLAVYILMLFFESWKCKKSNMVFQFKNWHIFCLAFILGSLWVYSQQIVTGRTVWPYHFPQYTIPLAMIVLITLFYNILKKESAYLWRAGIFIIVFFSLAIGIYTQAYVYQKFFYEYAARQSYVEIFNWLNSRKKDCVVLVRQNGREASKIEGLIPAFTHCNVYASSWIYTLMPSDRPQFNYMVILRLNGITGEEIDRYMAEHKGQENGYLFSNWKGLYGVKDFPDFSDSLLAEQSKQFSENYKAFMKKDFRAELERYKIDYILSLGPLDELMSSSLRDVHEIFKMKNVFIYSFN
ncbi:MAG: hypothetical protein HYW71_00285 [Candidatus Niyogibacteria bacterium]|nr:hypothetical protein [Candidatus Niyogibacteria bacterium]